MTRMIPRWIDDEAPASERRVFEKLERDPGTGNWTVLHHATRKHGFHCR